MDVLEYRTLMAGDLRFAVIGDYGSGIQAERDVANLVQSWNPAFVATVGDNNYPTGSTATIDQNIGQFYHSYLAPYNGNSSLYGPGASDGHNHFFPALGGADWGEKSPNPTGDQPYLNYFQGDLPSGPGNGRYYDVTQGNVELFVLDSEGNEPDGNGSTSKQALWLQSELATSTAQWKIVLDHTPTYSSGVFGNSQTLQWPFQAWGATAVVSGADHDYERLFEGGLPYFVDGLGGESLESPVPGTFEAGSQAHSFSDFGAMLIDATAQAITFQFVSRTGVVIDSSTIRAPNAPPPSPPAAPSGLTANVVSAIQANLSWTDNATGESGFLIQRSTDNVNFQAIARTASGVTTYQDTGLTPGTHYYYRVLAVTDTTPVGSSTPSQLQSTSYATTDATTPQLPAVTPTSLSSLTPDPTLSTGPSPLVSPDKSYFGNPMSLKGVPYAKGLGTHSTTKLVYNIGGQYSQFLADLGIDDEETGNPAYVDMQVLGDGKLLYDSGLILTTSATQHIDVNVAGVQQLTLLVNDPGEGTAHASADWAGARLY